MNKTLLWILLILCIGIYSESLKVRFPPEIKEQPRIRSIYKWLNTVAVITEKYISENKTYRYELYTIDNRDNVTIFKDILYQSCFDVVSHNSNHYMIIQNTKGTSLINFNQSNNFNYKTICDSLHGDVFKLAVDSTYLIAISNWELFLLQKNGEKRIPLNKIFNENRGSPNAILLKDSILYLGYDAGEWGGGLYALNLNDNKPSVKSLFTENISSIIESSNGDVWACGGLSHLSIVRTSLLKISLYDVVPYINQEWIGNNQEYDSSKSEMKLYKESKLISIVPTEKTYFLALTTNIGILKISSGKISDFYNNPLNFVYSMPKYRVGSYPVGMVVLPNGNIYVANRSLGIFKLGNYNSKWELTQILLNN